MRRPPSSDAPGSSVTAADWSPIASRRDDAGEMPTVADAHALGETVTVDGTEFTVEDVFCQRSVIEDRSWRTVHDPADAQMLVVQTSHLDYRGEPPLSLRLDGERVTPEKRVGLYGTRHAVSVPVRAVDSAAVVVERGEEPAWELPAEVCQRLASAPDFHLHDATVRTEDGRTVLSVTVENRGEREGTFRGTAVSAHITDADEPVWFPVPAGETVTHTVRAGVVDRWEVTGTASLDVSPDTRRFVYRYP